MTCSETRKNGLDSLPAQTARARRPPGASTRSNSRSEATASAKNITPRRQTTASKQPVRNGSAPPVHRANLTLRRLLRATSRFATATISAMGSVQVTKAEGPHTSAMRSDGSPVPAAMSSTDCPGPSPASAIKASERGSNIARTTAACLSQKGADSLHARSVAASCSFELFTSVRIRQNTGSRKRSELKWRHETHAPDGHGRRRVRLRRYRHRPLVVRRHLGRREHRNDGHRRRRAPRNALRRGRYFWPACPEPIQRGRQVRNYGRA